jgi:hypothetical protein
MNRTLFHRWLPFAVATGTALALWGLAAAHGHGWVMIWLPASVAGAAWPRRNGQTRDGCRSGAGASFTTAGSFTSGFRLRGRRRRIFIGRGCRARRHDTPGACCKRRRDIA